LCSSGIFFIDEAQNHNGQADSISEDSECRRVHFHYYKLAIHQSVFSCIKFIENTAILKWLCRSERMGAGGGLARSGGSRSPERAPIRV